MADIRVLIDNQNLGYPRNLEDLEITFEWLAKNEEGAISTTRMEFVLEAYKYLFQRFSNGLTGGVGIFEGVPLKIEIGQPGNPAFVFDGFLDGSDEANFIGNEEIIAGVKKRGGEDWLADNADGVSFAYLYSIGEITNGDFKKVPYVINYVPDGMQTIMLSISLFMMTKEIIENVKELSELVGWTVNASTPVIGVTVGVGGGVTTAWDLGDWILYGIKIAAKIIYIIAITIAIVKLIEELIKQMFPAKRDHLGMSVFDLLQKGCAHFGLQFQSSMAEELKSITYLPQKDKKGGSSGERGFPQNGDSIYLIGDAIRVFERVFNAEHKINGNIFRFERVDYWQQTSSFVLPNVFADQTRLLNSYIPNTSEFVANYNINWRYDLQDQNTLDDVKGLSYQAITKPIIVNDPKAVNMKGLTEIQIPFALGKRKDSFTALEKVARGVFKVVDNLTGIFGGGTNFANKIEARIGCLLLSSDFVTVGKLLKINGGKLLPNQRELLGAKTIWEKYHFVNSFAEINGIHNQWLKTREPVKIPFNETDLLEIIENNFVTDSQGKKAMIERLVWKPKAGTALINYRVNQKYTDNLKIEYNG